MERIDELLPGIEEFLSETLASEKLSPFAEQRRLFFLERLDIVKLPPTVPPREGRNVPLELLKDTEEKSGIPSSQITTRHQPDFAATQREISRSWRGTGSPVTEEREELHDGDDDSLEEVKVYDDIDLLDDSSKEDTDVKDGQSVDNPYDDEDIDDKNRSNNNNNNNSIILLNHEHDENDDNGENDYEIPVAMQQLSEDGGSHPSLALAESTEELQDDVLEPPSVVMMGPPPVPPPLPPRRDIRFSDSGSRSSINGLADEAPPDLPYRPPLPRRGDMCGRSERSDKSDPDLSGDGDSTSYESFDDEDEDPNNLRGKSTRNNNNNINDTASRNAGIKLPAKPSKKKTLKMSKKMSKSKSLSQWEISAPFRKLDNVDVSGELLHKGKLTWNRRLVAITNGCLAMYKPDKDGRPMSVIPLMGYEAMVTERKEKGRAFEIKLTHPQDDTHLFSVDVKEWAYAWKEHINNNSRGHRSSAGRTVRLSRALSSDLGAIATATSTLTQNNSNTGSHGSKTDLNGSNSNLSTGSEGARQEDAVMRPRLRSGNKVMRMGSFAFRATQFFENISKKTSVKRKQTSQSYSGDSSNSNNSGNSAKPRGVSVGSQDSQDHLFNSNSNNGSHSNILEESSISSNSTSNLPHSPFNTPTSDLNMPVFSDSNSNPSNSPTAITSPGFEDLGRKRQDSWTNQGITVNDPNFLQDVSHKGYLFIFSTFNRRRWGKRWCLVRGNNFECYRSENQPASQCELSLLLKACVLRRAVMETNSELALMLVDVDTNKEKITVEPVNDNEMPSWVSVLMTETATPSLPDGLQEYMRTLDARRGSECPSILSLSVLKQWDMDITLQSLGTSKENTSPENSFHPWNFSSSDKNSPEGEHHPAIGPLTPTPNEIDADVSPMFIKEASPPLPLDNLVAHIKKKHTTDSGFYSVKGNNSDSDGEHVDIVHTVNDMQREEKTIHDDSSCGFSVVESHFNHSKKSAENNNGRQSNNCDDNSKTVPLSESSFTQLCRVASDISDECSSHKTSKETNISLPSSESLPCVSQASSESSPSSHPCILSFRNTQAESSINSPRIPTQESETNKNISEPSSPKDEYTIVVKRSLRKKPKPFENNVSCELNNSAQNQDSSALTNKTSIADNSSTSEVMAFGAPNPDEEIVQDELPPLSPCESVYEDIDATLTNGSPSTTNVVGMDVGENGEVPHKSQCNEDRFDHLIQSLDEEKKNLQNRPSTSSISDIIGDNVDEASKSNGIESQKQDGELSDDTITKDDVIGTSASSISSISDNDTVTPSKLSITLISDKITPRKPVVTPLTIKSITVSQNNGDTHTPSTSTTSSSTSSCQSPELPIVEVHKPGMTEDELKEAIEGLKQKKSHLKRKRLAVHDKRQRVSSDEERLACEKEFASLEREVENTDSDIGFLQNQLDALCGHSLEAIKINNKKKAGSGKKRKSKRKAH